MEINIRRSKSTWSKPNLSASLLKLLPFERPLPLVKGSMDPCSLSPEPWGLCNPAPFFISLSSQSPIPAHLSFHMSHTSIPSTLFDGQPSVLASSSLHTQITTMLLKLTPDQLFPLFVFNLWTDGMSYEQQTTKKKAHTGFIPILNNIHDCNCAAG